MTERIKKYFKVISENIFSHQVGVFLIFLGISTVLWFVTTLNEEVQRQVVCRVNVTNIPDSATFINLPPTDVTAVVQGRGTQFLQKLVGSEQTVDIDFRRYVKNNRLVLSKKSLLDIVQNALGDELRVNEVFPDTIGVFYTTEPPFKVPVRSALKISTTPNMHILGQPAVVPDSVEVYAVESVREHLKDIYTVSRRIDNVSADRVVHIPLAVPGGCRAVPDSVNVRITVEPYITEVREIEIKGINVPPASEIVFTPGKIKASFRVPKSQRGSLPEVAVVADYATLGDNLTSGKIAVNADPWRSFIFLETDSVNFYLKSEQKGL